ncbi:MAG: hypothetical protein OEZ05_07370 [Nitrospirota bacterium]|nr:hypothetical protein [Nitrospirota bacterium]
MRDGILHRAFVRGIIVGISCLSFGCASSPAHQELFMGEGFQSALPKAGTQVVVWGNHSGALSRTLAWLQEHQLRAIDPSWIAKELSDPGFGLRTKAEQKTQVLAAAKAVGAPVVLFAQVEDNQLGRSFDIMSFGHQRLKIIGVEIRGIKTENGDVVFGAKAWNSDPLVESEQIVQDLTTFALQKAWNEADRPIPSQQEMVVQSSMPEHGVGGTPLAAKAPLVSEDLQPELVEPQPVQGHITVMPSSMEVSSPVSEVLSLEMAEPVSLEDDHSLGMQVASGALTVLYAPFKIIYAGVGGLMGGLAYLLTAGNEHTAQAVWDASLQGTYWLTPDHLQGNDAIHFKGESSPTAPLHQVRLD